MNMKVRTPTYSKKYSRKKSNTALVAIILALASYILIPIIAFSWFNYQKEKREKVPSIPAKLKKFPASQHQEIYDNILETMPVIYKSASEEAEEYYMNNSVDIDIKGKSVEELIVIFDPRLPKE